MPGLQNLLFVIKDISRLYARHFERHAPELKPNIPQCKILAALQRHAGISQARLSELTGMDPMTLVRLLDRLEADGLVERRQDPNDRRARQLFLLPAATPILDEVFRIADRARADALVGLTGPQREQLMQLLDTVHRTLLSLDAAAGETVDEQPPCDAGAPAFRLNPSVP